MANQPEDTLPEALEGPTRFGFVALIGATNAGKSTLMNALVGSKISIVSPKVQTTRSRITGLTMEGMTQIAFVDTPGIFQPRRRLDRAMVAAAWSGVQDADRILLLVDCARLQPDPDTGEIMEKLIAADRSADLILNKIDKVDRGQLLGIAADFNALRTKSGKPLFEDTYMIAAKQGDGLARLRGSLAARLPEGPWHFPEDQLSDLPLRLLAAEITREKLFLQLHQELPYATTVETESWVDQEDGSTRINQCIYVRREGQRAIVLGHRGEKIKAIGTAARTDIAALIDRPVHLFLFVKVRDNWEDDPERYRDWGLDFNA